MKIAGTCWLDSQHMRKQWYVHETKIHPLGVTANTIVAYRSSRHLAGDVIGHPPAKARHHLTARGVYQSKIVSDSGIQSLVKKPTTAGRP